jgi:hypothetical protein
MCNIRTTRHCFSLVTIVLNNHCTYHGRAKNEYRKLADTSQLKSARSHH